VDLSLACLVFATVGGLLKLEYNVPNIETSPLLMKRVNFLSLFDIRHSHAMKICLFFLSYPIILK